MQEVAMGEHVAIMVATVAIGKVMHREKKEMRGKRGADKIGVSASHWVLRVSGFMKMSFYSAFYGVWMDKFGAILML
ncbi:hypothetical protein LOK49_LG10G01074 [Camellia lanceoleosa]|uniref:Uncharacterized protein n=1 Tax=Camellia lanceoleosa TaxID=1840588 RepID=A0ACC0GAJ7_9ERIC|nr:hypothetical protein LOK49_LG10G01074 [Camellia lanceoleosa]